MFSDKSYDPVGFESQTTSEKSECTANVQTEEVVYKGSGDQAIKMKDAETQTIPEQKKKPLVDYEKLAAFLKRVTPAVLEELDEAQGSTSFDGYDPGAGGEPSVSVQLLMKLNTLEEANSEMKVSDATWSTGGGTLAVCHSVVHHETWCDHLSKIKFYNLTREDKLPAAANRSLELSACVTALSYHPTEPSIIAAGLFNGDVLVWNLRDETAVTPLQVCVHGDSVSVVHWRPRAVNNVSLIVTASNDGYILVQKLSANFTTVNSFKRFKIPKEHNPSEKTRPRSAGGNQERATESGLSITSLDFSQKDPTLFVVGTLCGGLYKCSVDQATPVEGSKDILDPVVNEFTRHEGSVTCVACSATRNIFITSGTDKEIRIYDFAESSVQQIITLESTVVGLSWFLGNTDLFVAYGAGSTVMFYNVGNGKSLANLNLETAGRESTSCLSFNSKRDMVAIGDTLGNVEIWRVPRRINV